MRQWPSSHQSKQPATWRYTLKRKLRILTEWFLDCGFARAVRVVAWREAGMAQPWPWEVEDGLWELIDPLLPKPERSPGVHSKKSAISLSGMVCALPTWARF